MMHHPLTITLPTQARRRSRYRLLAFGLAVAVLGAGCSSSKSVEGGGSTSTIAADTTAVPDSAAPITEQAVTTTTAAATTTTVAAPEPLVLRGDGIGSFALGAEATTVVDGVSAQLGAPVSDDSVDYPVADGLGQYTTEDDEFGFVAPMGRTVCWSMQFCAEFGGAAEASMSFTGWSYREDTTGALRSTSGVTLLTRWSEAPAITADDGGCYSVGSGSIDGIRLTLQSEGEPFGEFDALGNYVIGSPDPADVLVTWMETGEVPVFLYGDC